MLQVGVDAVQGMLGFFGTHELFFQDFDLALSKRGDGDCVLLGVVQLLRELLKPLIMLLHLLSGVVLSSFRCCQLRLQQLDILFGLTQPLEKFPELSSLFPHLLSEGLLRCMCRTQLRTPRLELCSK